MSTKISIEDKQAIQRMFQQEQKSLREIGETLGGVSKQTVWYHVRKMGLNREDLLPHKKLYNERRKRAREVLVEQPNISIKGLSEHIDCSWDTAKTIMMELGCYEESLPFSERVDAEKLIQFYVVEDLSLSELRGVYPEVSEMTLAKTLKQLGVPMRPQGASVGDIREDWRKEAIQKLGLTA